MLVLSRKLGQTVKVGDDITITVLGIQGKTLKIGIEAPRHVRVLRSEVRPWDEPVSDGRDRRRALSSAW